MRVDAGGRGHPHAVIRRGEAFMNVHKFARLAALFILLLPPALLAQDADGAIAGVVRDSSLAAVPGAVVHATNQATAASFDAVTDEQGNYQFSALVPGRYR